jgi:D-galactarolactone cycloisomerase
MTASPSRRNLLQSGALLAAGGIAAWQRQAFAEEAAEKQGREEHRIAAVKTFLLKYTLKRPFGVSVSVPLDKTRATLLVKVETEGGLVGWGETAPINGTRGTIDDHLAPSLTGKNPLDHRQLWRSMWGSNFGNALAVGALDMALQDLRGKILNLSVAEMYGGRLRDRVPAYASAMNYLEGAEPEDHYPAEAAKLVKQGFKALKMRLGRYPVAREAAVAKAVREAVGPDVRLMADGNYTLNSALAMGEKLHELKFDFWEEPLPQSPNYAGYEELREKLPLPLAAGEVLDSRATAKQLIDRRAMNIIQPDVSLCGGIGEALFISEMAALAGIGCVPHCWGGAILIAATVQLLSLMPDPHWGLPTDTPLLELDQSENPWRTELTGEVFKIRDGFVDVPQGPGLGIEVDQRAVEKYAV